MFAGLLSFRFADALDARQHAYRPGKSTLTAWGQILTETLTARNIFEFDLRGFFDNVGCN
jgi:retron-type reverse transcriptase